MKISDYLYTCKNKDGLFYLYIPELGIFSQGSSFDTAFKSLEKQFDESEQISKVFSIVRKPIHLNTFDQLKKDLVTFGLKALTVITLLTLVIAFSTPVFTSIVRNEIRQTFNIPDQPLKITLAKLPKTFNSKWARLTEQEKLEIQSEWSKMSSTLNPFISEIINSSKTSKNAKIKK